MQRRTARGRPTSRGTATWVAAIWLVAACCSGGSRQEGRSATSATVHVLYAGSLVNVMEKQVGPAFAAATGDHFEGYGADSQSVANAIKDRIRAGDVFISASPAVDAALSGPSNGSWVSWYATFATAPLVLGYSPSSRYASDLRNKPWYDVLREPGIRIGMTDPLLDPKGKLTVAALAKAGQVYHLPARYAASIRSKASVFPEQDLLGRLESGQLDVGFFYSDEATLPHLHTVTLGRVDESAAFTVTVLDRAANAGGGEAFVRYLLTAARPALASAGLRLLHPVVHGDSSAAPAALRSLLAGVTG